MNNNNLYRKKKLFIKNKNFFKQLHKFKNLNVIFNVKKSVIIVIASVNIIVFSALKIKMENV
jgi:hypothetical protein